MVATAKDKKRRVEPGIWKLENGDFYVDIRPEGRDGKKVRRTFEKLDAAKDFKTKAFATALGIVTQSKPTKDKRRLSDLVNEWYSLHGYSLKDGEGRKYMMLADCKLLNDPIAQKFTAEDFVIFRKARLETLQQGKNGKTISANTINHTQAYFCAVFNTLKRLGKWSYENPLHGLKKLKIDDPGLIFLDMDQIRSLLKELKTASNSDLLTIVKICLATGARWGEATTLQAVHIRHGKIHYSKTKSGKSRTVPISAEFEKEILNNRPRTGMLFNQKNHRKGFEEAINRAGISLPDGQLTHVLRHTFASHFMMNDGNILKLKDILGHSTLDMTIRYAKLAPGHLSQAITHNPLAKIDD
jgi:integrase